MSDIDPDKLTGWGDAYAVGEKVVEMCERVGNLHKIAPGVEAKWAIGVEDVEYEVIVRVKRKVD